jgi:hypothetical protein
MQAKNCDHHVPETLKNTGPCQIAFEVKKRNGKPNWWCTTHALEAGAPDGSALATCPGAWFDDQPAPRELEFHAADGEFSVWGAIEPALKFGECPKDEGGVHVHRRLASGEPKVTDDSFDIVRIRAANGQTLTIETMAAQAFSISELSGQQVIVLTCPKPGCRYRHIDELKFATNPHVKHLCNKCGRNFREREPSIGNPLADAYETLGIARPPGQSLVSRPLDLKRAEYSGIALWASNSAIVSNRNSPEDRGIHVHAWDHSGRQSVDDTFYPVYLDGEEIDEAALRSLNVQRELSHGAPIRSAACVDCGTSIISPSQGWIEPVTKHVCHKCGAESKTRNRSLLNPLAPKQQDPRP